MMRSNRYNRILCLLLAGCLLVPLLACDRLDKLFAAPPKEGLVINEVVTSNQLSLRDEVYGSPDWIELCNISDQSIQLGTYYITDNVACQGAFRLFSALPGERGKSRRRRRKSAEQRSAVRCGAGKAAERFSEGSSSRARGKAKSLADRQRLFLPAQSVRR